MPKVHVAGYDGSAAATAAVELAVLLAAPSAARVIAVTAYEAPSATLGKSESYASEALLAEEARHAAALVLADLHVESVERVTELGAPAPALCAVAEREDADVIVVGATHRGALGRIAPGSLAERLVHGSPCAIAVAPAEQHARPIRTIAVAYDGGSESVTALTAAQLLAREHGAMLRVLAVCEAPSATVDLPVMQIESPAHDRMEADVARIVSEMPEALHATGEVFTGRPGHALVSACADGVDLLVAGSRSYGPLRGALVGSVSRYVVDHAPCPVLVVPRGANHVPGQAPAATEATPASS